MANIDQKHYLTCLRFRVGREWYGLEVTTVVEVLPIISLNQVPDTDIVGMMTLREEVMPVIDLRQYLGLQDYAYTLDLPIIAIRVNGQSYGIIVDEADDVVEIDVATLTNHAAKYIEKVGRYKGDVIFIMNAEHLMPQAQHSPASG